MMTNRSSFVTHQRKTIGDTVVDGLLAGMVAGLAMGAVLIVLGLSGGVGLRETLARFDPAGASALTGGLLHIAVSGIYGILFVIVYRALGHRLAHVARFSWVLGLVYGFVLWLGAHFLLVPGLDFNLASFPELHFLAAHLVYGALLGYQLGRRPGE